MATLTSHLTESILPFMVYFIIQKPKSLQIVKQGGMRLGLLLELSSLFEKYNIPYIYQFLVIIAICSTM